MIVTTGQFGIIEIDEDKVISLPRGLVGYEDSTEFCIITLSPDANIKWLQSIREPDVAVMITDPSLTVPDYGFDLSNTEIEYLGIKQYEDIAVVNIVDECLMVGEGIIDLCNPIIINVKTLTGLQVALEDERYIEAKARISLSDAYPVEKDEARAA